MNYYSSAFEFSTSLLTFLMDSVLGGSYSNFSQQTAGLGVDMDTVSIWEALMATHVKAAHLSKSYLPNHTKVLPRGTLNCGLWYSYLLRFFPQFSHNLFSLTTFFSSQAEIKHQLLLPELPILEFPETIPFTGSFARLTKFHLISLKLFFLPQILYKLNDLVELILDSNCLSYFAIEYCSNEMLANLKILSLKNNWLSELPANYSRLCNLEVLSIDENNITSLEPLQLNKLTKLVTLNASSNKFMVFPANFTSGSLENIDLSNNNFYSIPYFFFQNSTSLKKVIFSNNPLRALPTSIQYLTQLDCLIAQECNLNEIIGEFSSCVELKTLNLAGNKIDSINDCLCTNLTSLNLSRYELAIDLILLAHLQESN
jgi:Leucine-rich repeat (LRR) protein